MPGKHSVPPRGLTSTRRSPQFEGKFGRMFRGLHPAFDPDDDSLEDIFLELGDKMSAGFDGPKDGPDDEESGIPALYTYLGQFIDHDITFDPASSLQQANDPDGLVDFRTPAFDLDNVYGRGPDDQPYMYDGPDKFLPGTAIQGAGDAKAVDLPRSPNGRALIGDPRNDENAIVSQLQGLFLRFHNRFRDQNQDLSFADIQEQVRFHYQFVVLNDFLPRIVDEGVLNQLRTNGKFDRHKIEFYEPRNSPFLPVEFSVAAYRLGHSMIRPGYRLNDSDRTLLPIFPVRSQGLNEGLTGFRPLNPHWAIDWSRFIDLELRPYGVKLDDNGKTPEGKDPTPQQIADNKQRLQLAYRLDTSLVNPLHDLPPEVAANPSSLAARNLLRAWRLGLPSGQAVAKKMQVPHVLDDSEILIGKATDDPDPDAITIDKVADGAFIDKCPLWTYILAEAALTKTPVQIPVKGGQTISTPKLGPVGGRIVAEVFLGLMFGDPHSMLSQDPNWTPKGGANFKLKDFVAFALGK